MEQPTPEAAGTTLAIERLKQLITLTSYNFFICFKSRKPSKFFVITLSLCTPINTQNIMYMSL